MVDLPPARRIRLPERRLPSEDRSAEITLSLPSLMITAEWDAALPPSMAKNMPSLLSDLEMHMIAGCGHWTQQDKPEELNQWMVDWLTRRFLPPRAS